MSKDKNTLDDRLNREVLHGKTDVAVQQAESGWTSAAGKIRRQRRAEFLVRGLPRKARVLEIGTGTGLQTAALLNAFENVVGIDISPDLLAIAERRAPGGHYCVMDGHRPDFPDGSFDAIVGVSVLHHLDWDMALENYHRLLRPNGIVRFSEPNLFNPLVFVIKSIPWIKCKAGDSPDEYAFTRWRIRRSLVRAGFTDIVIRPFEFLHYATPERWIPLVLKIENLVSRSPIREIGASLLIDARRPH
jgi:SAM-dependent methyltransferase